MARLTQDLDVSVKESKSLQMICRDLQREVAQHKAAASKTTGLSKQVEQFEAEVQTIATILNEKSRRLEGLSDTCRDVASMLRSLGKA